jgi:hypothetical protein
MNVVADLDLAMRIFDHGSKQYWVSNSINTSESLPMPRQQRQGLRAAE